MLNEEENSGDMSDSQPPHPLLLQSTARRRRPPITYIRRKYRNLESSQTSFIEGVQQQINGDRRGQNPKSNDRSPQSRAKATINQKGRSLKGDDSDSDWNPDDEKVNAKMHRIGAANRRSDDVDSTQQKKASRKTQSTRHAHGMTTLTSSQTPTPLPDIMPLVSLINKLQKKDTFRAFSKPVDINELPDYYEVVEKAMDFGTIRRKLAGGVDYKCLEDLEADVMLICSNAMRYNQPDTVYYEQAREIQELAKEEFDRFKNKETQVEEQAKDVLLPRKPSRGKTAPASEPAKSDHNLENSPPPAVPPAITSTQMETRSTLYNLRKVPASARYRSDNDFLTSGRAKRTENPTQVSGNEWNSEFPESVLKGDARQRKKNINVDDTRRDTYLLHKSKPPIIPTKFPDPKQMLRMVPSDSFDYAKSLARFTAGLGDAARKVALMKMKPLYPYGAPNHIIEMMGGTPTTTATIMPQDSIFTQSTEGFAPAINMVPTTTATTPQDSIFTQSAEGFAPAMNMIPAAPMNPAPSYPIMAPVARPEPELFVAHGLYQRVFPSVHVPAGNPNYGIPERAGVEQGWHMPLGTNNMRSQGQFLNPRGEDQDRVWGLLGSTSRETIPQQQRQWNDFSVHTELTMRINPAATLTSSGLQIGSLSLSSSSSQQPNLSLQL